MSTILEALKKSEQERKLNKLPTLNDMPPPQEASRWPLVLAVAMVLLALAMIALAYVWWNSQKEGVADNAAKPSTVMAIEKTDELTSEEGKSELAVNVISYSDDAAERFAMIDGKIVREGEFVRAGLQLEEIRPDVVVLNLRGKQIILGPQFQGP